MSKKENHIEQSKVTRFRSFEEMKSAPVSFPSNEPLAQRQAEYMALIAKLRASLPDDVQYAKNITRKR